MSTQPAVERRDFCKKVLTGGAFAALPTIAVRSFAVAPETDAQAQIPAIKNSGGPTFIPTPAIKTLAGRLRGRLIAAGDPDYDDARRVWNRMIDRRPALIVKCQGAADITRAVEFARERELLVAVRGGGHSYPGYSTCDGGLVVDLSPMRAVRADPFSKVARVAGGAWIGDLDWESQQYGLATPMGRISNTGVGGLTLGGGYGVLSRRYGLACDNMIAADVITADAKLLRVSAHENPDLLWALRGGGGNFGVVSSFEYQLHPVGPKILAGTLTYAPRQMRAVLEQFVEVCAKAPRELDIVVALYSNSQGVRAPFVLFRYVGDPRKGEKLLTAIRTTLKPESDDVKLWEYASLQKKSDGPILSKEAEYAKSGHVHQITPALVDALLQEKLDIALALNGGAIADVPSTASAITHRRELFQMELSAEWQDLSTSDENRADVRAAWERLQPFTSGFYANLTVADQKAIDDNYGPNRQRLMQIKKQYDPTNFFRLNANIPPAT